MSTCIFTDHMDGYFNAQGEADRAWDNAKENGETIYMVDGDESYATYEAAMEAAIDYLHDGQSSADVAECWRWTTPNGDIEHDTVYKHNVLYDKHERLRVFNDKTGTEVL